MGNFTEQNIFIFLTQIFLLLGLARGLGELFRKWKQPALTAEILVGLFLGPTIFGRFLPGLHNAVFPNDPVQQNMLATVAWLGLLFFLLETGLKMDFTTAWRHRGKALTIAVTDIVVPMAIAFTCSMFLPSGYLTNPDERLIFAFFMATAMTISSMPIAVRALNDLDIEKTDLGFLIMSALSANEIIGWVMFTFILNFLAPSASWEARKIILVFSALMIFIVFCLTIGRKLADFFVSGIKKYALPEPGSSLTLICLLGFLCGAALQKMGVNALIGFFIAGIMAGEAKGLPGRTRQVISQMVYAVFIPLFFASIGLNIDFLRSFNVFLVVFVTGISIAGKFLGAYWGSGIAGLAKENRLPLSVAHIPGGSMEIVIGALALQNGLISEAIFVAILCGGVLSSIALGPWLRYAVTRRREIGILEFFSRNTVIAEIKSTDRNGAIKELCAAIADQGKTPHLETLYSNTIRRENSMATSIEEGVAIPHARISSLIKPFIAFGRSGAGIDWDSPDGKPTHFIFLILTPKENDWVQIQILRIIAQAISDKRAREAITMAGDETELWQTLERIFTAHHIVRKSAG